MSKIFRHFFGNELVEVFSYLPFFFFILSVFFSQIALNMLNIVLIFLMFNITSSNFSVSLLVGVFVIPQIFLSFIGGIVADIYNKKLILMHGNLMRAVTLLALFVNNTSIFIVYFISFFISVFSQFYIPAETPIIPKLVKKKNLSAANSIFGIALFGSILIGYVLAGPALTLLGSKNIFLFLSALFAISSLSILFIPSNLLHTKSKQNEQDIFVNQFSVFVKRELKKTLSLLKDIDGVGLAFMLLILSQIIILIFASVMTGYAKSVLEIDPEKISLLLFAPAVTGVVISSLVIGRFPHNFLNKEKLMMLGVFLSGVVILLFPFMSRIASRDWVIFINSFLPSHIRINALHLTMVLAFLAGVANALIFIPSQTIIQDKIPEIFRSKFYGLLYSLIGLFCIVPIIIAGVVADIFGVNSVIFGTGAFILIIGFAKWGLNFLNLKNLVTIKN